VNWDVMEEKGRMKGQKRPLNESDNGTGSGSDPSPINSPFPINPFFGN